MRALVLGATGFIGGQIARAALAAGYAVRALRRRPAAVGALADIADRIEWVTGDLDDPSALVAAADGCEVLFHAAAYYPSHSRDLWGQVTYAQAQMARVLTAARRVGVERLVYTSSLTTIGRPSQPGRLADERDFYRPGTTPSAYYETKYAMEQMALHAAADGLPVVILCPTAVFGPGDVKPTTGRLLLEVARGRVPVSFDAVINVVDGRDLAAMHLAAAVRGRIGQRYIIGGHNLRLQEGLTLAAQIAGVAPPRFELPTCLVHAAVRIADGLPGVTLPEHARTLHLWQPLSTLKARRELGLRPRPFAETVRDTLEWFRGRGMLG